MLAGSVKKKKEGGRLWVCSLWIPVCIYILMIMCSDPVRAQGEELPEEVVIVKNETQMIKRLLKGMRKHQSYFYFYYPKLGKDFAKYRKKSKTYQPFLDKLAIKDGYITGILSGSCIMVSGGKKQYVTIQFHYLTTKFQEKKINAKVKRLAKRFRKGSRAVRAKKAHDYLIDHMRYDKRYYNPYYAFTKGRGICMAYALAYQRLLQEMDIPCVYVKGVNHAWNMVKIGKYWYNVDVTWDDSGRDRYRYFLKSDKDFPRHIPVKSRNYPSLFRAKTSYRFP